MKKYLFSSFLAAVLLGASLPAPILAQEEADNSAQLHALGAASGQAIYITYMAVNTLGDAWKAKAYDDATALSLVGSYEGGLKVMKDSISNLLENGKGVSEEDQTFLAELVECSQLVLSQITSLKGYMKTGDEAKAKTFEAQRKVAQKRIFTLLGIEGDEGGDETSDATPEGEKPKTATKVSFKITEAKNPDGSEGQLGVANFARSGDGKAFGINWKYDNGGSDKGVGVPLPGTGAIAVGFGPDVLAVAIYKLNGKSVDGRWADYEQDAEIGTYKMEQSGEEQSLFTIEEDGGTVEIDLKKARTANITWKLPSGELKGIGVAEGDYLAAVAVKPGGKGGVAIYMADPASGTASGRWTMPKTIGTAGEEKYELVSME